MILVAAHVSGDAAHGTAHDSGDTAHDSGDGAHSGGAAKLVAPPETLLMILWTLHESGDPA